MYNHMDNIMKKVVSTIEKKCDTCADLIVCWADQKLQEEACEDWKPELNEFIDAWDKLAKKENINNSNQNTDKNEVHTTSV